MYEVNKCYTLFDNIVGVSLKSEAETLGIYCIYLLPECSKYSGNNEHILNSLTIEIYKQSDMDGVYVCGDFNARVGSRSDVQIDIDEIPKHNCIDEKMNPQGFKLLSFVNDIRGCILNGRITPELNDYTSVTSHKGCAVVDYCIARQHDLDQITMLNVQSCAELINVSKWHTMVNDRSRIPDHNLIMMKVELSVVVREKLLDKIGRNLSSDVVKRVKIYRKVGENFMNSDLAVNLLPLMLEEMNGKICAQDDINGCYTHLTDLILHEAEQSNKVNKKRHAQTEYKEYWDSELKTLWNKNDNM